MLPLPSIEVLAEVAGSQARTSTRTGVLRSDMDEADQGNTHVLHS